MSPVSGMSSVNTGLNGACKGLEIVHVTVLSAHVVIGMSISIIPIEEV